MPPLTDDLTPAELTGHEDAPLERFCRGGGEGDLAAAFFGFWGRPHHTSLLRGVVAQKTAEFESLCAKINEVEKKLDVQKREALRLESLSAEVSQGKAVCAELSLEFARAFPTATEPAVSASEIFYAFKKNLNEYFDGLKNPLYDVR